jgi:glycerol-3-phosphate acyltransferase PlsX
MITQFMKEEFTRNVFAKLAALMALPVLNALRRRLDPRQYNGASLVGLNGIVIKSHGGTDAIGFEYAIHVAAVEVQNQLPQLIGERLTTLQGQSKPSS